jgi:ankyrin repeat protein/Leucine-rich repeat (LRR) protein
MHTPPTQSRPSSPSSPVPSEHGSDTNQPHQFSAAANVLAPVNVDTILGATDSHTSVSQATLVSPFTAPGTGAKPLVRSESQPSSDDSQKSDDAPLLIDLVRQGKPSELQKLLERGGLTEPGQQVHEGANALHWAVTEGHEKIVEWLLKQGWFDLSAKDAGGNTALHLVADTTPEQVRRCKGTNEQREKIAAALLSQPRIRECLLVTNDKGLTSVALAALDVESKVYGLIKDVVDGTDNDVSKPVEDDRRSIALSIKSALRIGKRGPSVGEARPHSPHLPALLQAAGAGDLDVVRQLLSKHDVQPNDSDDDGRTVLHLAAGRGHLGVVDALLKGISVGVPSRKKRADPNRVTRKGETPLIWAVVFRKYDVVERLVNGGTDINRANGSGVTPLMCAAQAGDAKCVRLLLGLHAKADWTNKDNNSAIRDAASNGHVECVNLLLPALDSQEIRSGQGALALTDAARSGHEAVVQILAPLADLTISPLGFGDTALVWAASYNHHRVVKLLLDEVVDAHAAGASMALRIAVAAGHAESVALLVKHADVEGMDDQMPETGDTLLMNATHSRHHEVMRVLIDNGANVDLGNNSGNRPIHIAIFNRDAKAAEILLETCSITIRRPALIFAAIAGMTSCIPTLLKRPDIDVNVRDSDELGGKTAFHTAAIFGHADVVALLLQHAKPKPEQDVRQQAEPVPTPATQVDPMLVGADGETALHSAASEGHADVVVHLLDYWGFGEQGLLNAIWDRAGDKATALMQAARCGHLKVVKLLLKAQGIQTGAEIVLPDGSKQTLASTAFTLAVAHGHADIVAEMLDCANVDVMWTDAQGHGALHVAAARGHVPVLQVLLADKQQRFGQNGCLNARTNETGSTALIEASRAGHMKALRLLHRQPGIQADIADSSGYRAIVPGDELQPEEERASSSVPTGYDLYRARTGAGGAPASALSAEELATLRKWLGFSEQPGGDPELAEEPMERFDPAERANRKTQLEATAWLATALRASRLAALEAESKDETEARIKAKAKDEAVDEVLETLGKMLKATPLHARREAAVALETLARKWPDFNAQTQLLALDACFAQAKQAILQPDDDEIIWLLLCNEMLPASKSNNVRDRTVDLLLDIHDRASHRWGSEGTTRWMPGLTGHDTLARSLDQVEAIQRPDIANRLRPRLQLSAHLARQGSESNPTGQIRASGLYWRRKLPEGIGTLGWMSQIDFSNNLIDKLPQDVHAWQIKGELNLSGNRLTSLPADITWLTEVTELDLSGNALESLPEGFAKLKNLRRINLSNNPRLISLADDVGQWAAGCEILIEETPQLPALTADYVKNGRKDRGFVAKFARHPELQGWLRKGSAAEQKGEHMLAEAFARCLDGKTTEINLSKAGGLSRWPSELMSDPRMARVTRIDLSGTGLANPGGFEHLPLLSELDLRGCKLLDVDLARQLQDKDNCTVTVDEAGLSPATLAVARAAVQRVTGATFVVQRNSGGRTTYMPEQPWKAEFARWGKANQRAADLLRSLMPTPRIISLSDRKLKDLPSGIYRSWSAITRLDLSANSLKHLEAFDGMPNLRELDLGKGNELQRVDGLPSLTSLEELQLDHLPLKGELDLSGLASLKHLYIQNTEISSLRGAGQLTSLMYLDATACKKLDKSCFAKLPRNCRITFDDVNHSGKTRDQLARSGDFFPPFAQAQVDRARGSTGHVELDFTNYGLTSLPQGLAELLEMPGRPVSITLDGNDGLPRADLFALLSLRPFRARIELSRLDLRDADVDLTDRQRVGHLLSNLGNCKICLTQAQFDAVKSHIEGAPPPNLPKFEVDGEPRELAPPPRDEKGEKREIQDLESDRASSAHIEEPSREREDKPALTTEQRKEIARTKAITALGQDDAAPRTRGFGLSWPGRPRSSPGSGTNAKPGLFETLRSKTPWTGGTTLSAAAKAALVEIEDCRQKSSTDLTLTGGLSSGDLAKIADKFKGLDHVTKLELTGCALSRVPPLKHFPALRVLEITDNAATSNLIDTGEIAKARTLTRLSLANARLLGELNLSGLDQLTELELQGNPGLTDLRGFQSVAPSLTLLNLEGTGISQAPAGTDQLNTNCKTKGLPRAMRDALRPKEDVASLAGSNKGASTASGTVHSTLSTIGLMTEPLNSDPKGVWKDVMDMIALNERIDEKLAVIHADDGARQYFEAFYMSTLALLRSAIVYMPQHGTRADVVPQMKTFMRSVVDAGLTTARPGLMKLDGSKAGNVTLPEVPSPARLAVAAAITAFQKGLEQYNLAEFNRFNTQVARIVKPGEVEAFSQCLAIAMTELMIDNVDGLKKRKTFKHATNWLSGTNERSRKLTALRDSSFGHSGLIIEALAKGEAFQGDVPSDATPQWKIRRGIEYFFREKTKYTLEDPQEQLDRAIVWEPPLDEKVQWMGRQLPSLMRSHHREISGLRASNTMLQASNTALEDRVQRLEDTLNQVLTLLPGGVGQSLKIPSSAAKPKPPLQELPTPEKSAKPVSLTAKSVTFDMEDDSIDLVDAARTRLSAPFESQSQLRCLQHAFNNGWRNLLILDQASTHPKLQASFNLWMQLSAQEAGQSQELIRLNGVTAPDGHEMRRVRLFPAQVQALVPVFTEHLDLAVIYKGETNLDYQPGMSIPGKHYTALIKVDGMHFELESLGHDEGTRKRFIPDLQAYFDGLPGGVWMAVPGHPDHPLAAFLAPLEQERFMRTCEALGVLADRQPIEELAAYLALHPLADPADLNAEYMAAFCSEQAPGAKAVARTWPGLRDGATDRAASIVQWLDALPEQRTKAVLWTGTDPMVVMVERDANGQWQAHVLKESDNGQRDVMQPLQKLLAEQDFGNTAEASQRRGYLQALTLDLGDGTTDGAELDE